MKNKKASRKAVEVDQDFQAYVYQQLYAFEMYTNENTTLTVVEKNCQKVIKKMQDNEELFEDMEGITDCVSIKLEDADTQMKIESIGFGKDPYSAVADASQKLLKTLNSIHDETVTPQERVAEVNDLINKPKFLH